VSVKAEEESEVEDSQRDDGHAEGEAFGRMRPVKLAREFERVRLEDAAWRRSRVLTEKCEETL